MTIDWDVSKRIGEALMEAYLDGLREALPGLLSHANTNSNESFPLRIGASLHSEDDLQEEALALEIDFHQGGEELTFACDVVKGVIDYGAFGPQSSFDRDSSFLTPWVLRSLADAFEFFEAQQPAIVEALRSKGG